MRFAIPVTEDTTYFIGKFLNNGIVPEVDERGSMFVLTDDADTPPDIVPADDEMFRVNNWNFKFASLPMWIFRQ